MANFDSIKFLQQGLSRLTPQGGFGIPNIGALQELLKQQSASGLRQTQAQDWQGLQRAGMGRSVAGAFAPGTRGLQFNQDLMAQLQKLFSENAQMSQAQKAQILGMLSGAPLQAAYQDANKPSWLSSLLGNVLGTGAQMAMPWASGKIFGNPGLDQLMAALEQK
jgi:hypothetical protein